MLVLYFDLIIMRLTKNVAVAGGMVAAVVLAFYPIYFRPKFFPEQYSELSSHGTLTLINYYYHNISDVEY